MNTVQYDPGAEEGYAGYSIDDIVPAAVLRPSSEDELCEIVGSADRDGTAVFPWGGGTRMNIGNVPQRQGIVVDTRNLNRVVSHNSADLTATFQAGITLQTVSEVLAGAGQILAIDPPLPHRATIGGVLATGISGPTKWHFGHLRDTVIGMKIVQPDGTVAKSGGQVVKNVSGYDMSRLHIGGLGGLGLILEASFKLTPDPMYQTTMIAEFGSVAESMACALEVFNSHVTPLALTGFNEQFGRTVGFDRPARDYLAVRLGGRPRTLDRQVNEIGTAYRRHGASDVEQRDGPVAGGLWHRLADFGWDHDSEPSLNVRITVMPNEVAGICQRIQSLKLGGTQPAVVCQPGFGTVEASWFDPEPTDGGPTDLKNLIRSVRETVGTVDGRTVVQRCPTEIKREFDVWGDEPSGIVVMRRLKSQYDPNNIMNPGRLVGRI